MSKKLSAEQKTVLEFLGDKNVYFLVPDYQRPYEWGEDECETLWDDVFAFAFPDEANKNFDPYNDEYFFGSTVFYKNTRYKNKKEQKEVIEVIDGQQRITTLMLLLRAFYKSYEKFKDDHSVNVCREIEKCIWKTDEYGKPYKNSFKIDSEVATDETKNEFFHILETGETEIKGTDNEETTKFHSRYAENYKFFQDKIGEFLSGTYHVFSADLPKRLLNDCIFLQMETDSFDTAMRVFYTLNDRGKPLSDSDIFKSKLYQYCYKGKNLRDKFFETWKNLEQRWNKIYSNSKKTAAIDEAFRRYMYYERAHNKVRTTTTGALRIFYEKNDYELLRKSETFKNIISMTNFWFYVNNQSKARFSDRVLKRLFVLNYAPNDMWVDFVSVYYIAKRDKKGLLDDEAFYNFLNKTIAFIWGFALMNPSSSTSALRTPIYNEMVNIVEGKEVNFSNYLFDTKKLKAAFENYKFSNNRPFTKSMLAWWALENEKQSLLELTTAFDIEHIYPQSRYKKGNTLSSIDMLEAIGNKSLLEKNINISASDYRFSDKVKYYKGFTEKDGVRHNRTKIRDLLDLAATKKDFTEQDIVQRNAAMESAFIKFMKTNGLLKS